MIHVGLLTSNLEVDGPPDRAHPQLLDHRVAALAFQIAPVFIATCRKLEATQGVKRSIRLSNTNHQHSIISTIFHLHFDLYFNLS